MMPALATGNQASTKIRSASAWKIENQVGHEAGLLERGTLIAEGIADDPSVADRVVTERVNMPMYPCAGTVSFDHRSEIRGRQH